jgi:hypothetical protein
MRPVSQPRSSSAEGPRRALGASRTRLRPWLSLLLVLGSLAPTTGCLIPMYSADPARRAQQLLYTSEDLRAFLDEWERIWFLDQPSTMTPYRTSGLIL